MGAVHDEGIRKPQNPFSDSNAFALPGEQFSLTREAVSGILESLRGVVPVVCVYSPGLIRAVPLMGHDWNRPSAVK